MASTWAGSGRRGCTRASNVFKCNMRDVYKATTRPSFGASLLTCWWFFPNRSLETSMAENLSPWKPRTIPTKPGPTCLAANAHLHVYGQIWRYGRRFNLVVSYQNHCQWPALASPRKRWTRAANQPMSGATPWTCLAAGGERQRERERERERKRMRTLFGWMDAKTWMLLPTRGLAGNHGRGPRDNPGQSWMPLAFPAPLAKAPGTSVATPAADPG